jgi:hypothetical protein
MSTRSRIGMTMPDGTVQSVYCHHDGYLKHNGLILLECYSDPEKLQELLNLGALSGLGRLTRSWKPSDGDMEPVGTAKGTVAFLRDKKRKDTPMVQTFVNEADYWRQFKGSWEEFGYLLQPTGWVYRKGGTRNLPLTHAAISRES